MPIIYCCRPTDNVEQFKTLRAALREELSPDIRLFDWGRGQKYLYPIEYCWNRQLCAAWRLAWRHVALNRDRDRFSTEILETFYKEGNRLSYLEIFEPDPTYFWHPAPHIVELEGPEFPMNYESTMGGSGILDDRAWVGCDVEEWESWFKGFSYGPNYVVKQYKYQRAPAEERVALRRDLRPERPAQKATQNFFQMAAITEAIKQKTIQKA